MAYGWNMRRTEDYAKYELLDEDIGTQLEECLTDMAEMASGQWGGDEQDADIQGMKRNAEFLKGWSPTKEESARWCALLYSQWLLGKFEDDTGVRIDAEKNAAVKKYIDSRVPQIFAYIEAGCPGFMGA